MRPSLTLVPGCGALMGESPALARSAAKKGPVNVGPNLLAADRPAALSLHVDDDGFPDVLPSRDGLTQVAEGCIAPFGERLLAGHRKGIQVLTDALHDATLPMGKVLSSPAGHLRGSNRVQNQPMPSAQEKWDVRRRRLKVLRDTYPEMNDAEFAKNVLDVDPNYYSRLKNGVKNIGDMCREWETDLSLGVGWFDQDGEGADPPPARMRITPDAIRMAEAYDDLDRQGRIKMNELLAKLQRERIAIPDVAPARKKKPVT
jgi:hypothetical protein